MDTFRQLIAAAGTATKPLDWADPVYIAGLAWPDAEKQPLEALRAATLLKYPDLANTPPPEAPADTKSDDAPVSLPKPGSGPTAFPESTSDH